MTRYLAIAATPEVNELIADSSERDFVFDEANDYSEFEQTPVVIVGVEDSFEPDDDENDILFEDVKCIVFKGKTYVLGEFIKETETPREPERWLKKYERIDQNGKYWLVFDKSDSGIFITVARAESRGDIVRNVGHVGQHNFEEVNKDPSRYVVCEYTKLALRLLGLKNE